MEIRDIAGGMKQCKAYTRKHAKSFYFASHVLPRHKRYAAYAVYAFCRYADNIVDRHTGTVNAARKLDELRQELDRIYGTGPLKRDSAFAETVREFGIPREYFDDLLLGVEMDLEKRHYKTFDELLSYCYHVASVVGLIMTRIFGSDGWVTDREAVSLGVAMQLTNILRDIDEDQALGRMYLPLDELHAYGLSPDDIRGDSRNERFRRFMAFQVGRARRYYEYAEAGIARLTNDGSRLCVRLMSGIYSDILRVIEKREYDVFAKRAYVPIHRKMLIGLRTIFTGRNRRPPLSVPLPVSRKRTSSKGITAST